jgi:MFS family permease
VDRLARRILLWHVVATLLISTGAAVLWLLPLLALRVFLAGDWQLLAITAAGPTLLTASIFWNQLLTRLSLRRYLALYWLVGVFPLGLVGLVQHFPLLLLFHVIAAIGSAGWSPLSGILLKRFYPDHARGRAFGIVSAATIAGAMAAAAGIGRWLDADPQAFRIYMPLAALVQALGVLLLMRLVGRCAPAPVEPRAATPMWRAAVEPLAHLRRVLRADRTFFDYEVAFMTYGVGWMICNALLPLLVERNLALDYAEFSQTTLVATNIAMLLLLVPMGWLLDRLGAARTCALAFVLLCLYPIGLLAAATPLHVAAASTLYGVAMAGVQMGWMLGPVTLAPSAARVPEYVAIHTTLVGLRGILAQGLGMALYKLSGSFAAPLLIAAAAFLWAALRMWRLHAAMRVRAPQLPPPPVPGAPELAPAATAGS